MDLDYVRQRIKFQKDLGCRRCLIRCLIKGGCPVLCGGNQMMQGQLAVAYECQRMIGVASC